MWVFEVRVGREEEVEVMGWGEMGLDRKRRFRVLGKRWLEGWC